jgi:hypothetical protein
MLMTGGWGLSGVRAIAGDGDALTAVIPEIASAIIRDPG